MAILSTLGQTKRNGTHIHDKNQTSLVSSRQSVNETLETSESIMTPSCGAEIKQLVHSFLKKTEEMRGKMS